MLVNKAPLEMRPHAISKIMGKAICSLVVLINFYNSAAQPSDYFRNPLDIPIQLSANFGEIRPDHFHTGFDIRTNEKTGYKVYAAAEGYVSRIKISAGGFGKVIYITHPNGYMTVYAHLDRFQDAIADYVKQQQYAKESFEIELFPPKEKFPVKKGDWIALSGNSGASGGPHLHFEIRDASGETFPLNPAAFFKLEDTIAPKINSLYLYPVQKVTGPPVRYAIKKDRGRYVLLKDSIIIDAAAIGVALDVKDYMNKITNDYGIYEMNVKVDDHLIYEIKFDRLNFSNGRYANAYIDYREKKKSGTVIQRLFRLPGDHNDLYNGLVNDGKILFADTFFHTIKITAMDAYGNQSYLSFLIRSSGRSQPENIHLSETIFKYNQPNSFTADSIKLNFPSNALYEDLDFQYFVSQIKKLGAYSAIHLVHNPYIPLNSSYDISLLPRFIPGAFKPKAVIVYEDGKGNISSKTSHWEGNWLSAHAREFGNFYVMIDTVAPVISAAPMKQNQLITSSLLKFTVKDNLSGIVAYKGMLDGKWVLMEYDPKNNRLSCELEKNLAAGEHELVLTVADDVKNEGNYTLKFRK